MIKNDMAADLREAGFLDASLVGTDLRQADLRSANLEHVNLTGAKFTRDCRQQALFGVRLSHLLRQPDV
ncbi:hypothetical protein DFAR_2550011 [Desulfarculales bacterium]